VKLGDYIYAVLGGIPNGNPMDAAGIPVSGNPKHMGGCVAARLPCWNGGAMATDGSRYIYAQTGGENDMTGRRFYRYDSQTKLWERMSDTPAMIRYGGGLVYAGSSLYSYQGYNKAFWKYTPAVENRYVTTERGTRPNTISGMHHPLRLFPHFTPAAA
jgi:hypothetical protein